MRKRTPKDTEYNRRYEQRHEDKVRVNRWKQQGIVFTVEEYDELFKKQGGKCAVCKVHQIFLRRRFNVDHSHQTGKVRGLLCDKCNKAIGLFQDDPTLLNNGFEYLKNN